MKGKYSEIDGGSAALYFGQVWELDRVVRFIYGMENHGVKPF